MTIFLSEDAMTNRRLPAGCDQQGRETPRAVHNRWHETIPTDYGSADALGDDQAERHSAWGAISECAIEGGRHREPSRTVSGGPGLLASLMWPIGAVAAIAAAAVLMH